MNLTRIYTTILLLTFSNLSFARNGLGEAMDGIATFIILAFLFFALWSFVCNLSFYIHKIKESKKAFICLVLAIITPVIIISAAIFKNKIIGFSLLNFSIIVFSIIIILLSISGLNLLMKKTKKHFHYYSYFVVSAILTGISPGYKLA